tara:strand:- start:565 stop:795 length:231 start_codon:yes stop_codon:yes gene_type:complete
MEWNVSFVTIKDLKKMLKHDFYTNVSDDLKVCLGMLKTKGYKTTYIFKIDSTKYVIELNSYADMVYDWMMEDLEVE